jgi:hypothetical protein
VGRGLLDAQRDGAQSVKQYDEVPLLIVPFAESLSSLARTKKSLYPSLISYINETQVL